MSKNRELCVVNYTSIIVCDKTMCLSFRVTRKDVKYYLHLPLRKVYTSDEISKELFDTLVKIKHTSKPKAL